MVYYEALDELGRRGEEGTPLVAENQALQAEVYRLCRRVQEVEEPQRDNDLDPDLDRELDRLLSPD